MKSIAKLRQSDYHQQLGRKMCAAYIAQQQGIALSTAFKKVPDPILDLWLVVAEFAHAAWTQNIDQQYGLSEGREIGPVI
jgi:hypothetical protein